MSCAFPIRKAISKRHRSPQSDLSYTATRRPTTSRCDGWQYNLRHTWLRDAHVAALAVGALIGYERERVGKAAGLRTHMLVAMGTASFVISALESGMGEDAVSRVIQGLVNGAATGQSPGDLSIGDARSQSYPPTMGRISPVM